jgi:hypothetical protein
MIISITYEETTTWRAYVEAPDVDTAWELWRNDPNGEMIDAVLDDAVEIDSSGCNVDSATIEEVEAGFDPPIAWYYEEEEDAVTTDTD